MDETIKAADNFFKGSSGPFIYFMLVLTTATVLISGCAYHDFKNRCFMAFAFLKLHREIERTKKSLTKLNQDEIEHEARLKSFDTHFNHGLMMAEHKTAETAKSNPLGGQIRDNVRQNIGFIISSPIVLALIVILLLFFFRSAVKAETIILYDLTMSSEVNDYSGRETEFQKNNKGIETFIQNDMALGERIRVVGITERSFSNPYILLEGETPQDKGAFGEKLAKGKMRLLQNWKKLNIKPGAKSTDIFGAVQLATILFSPNDKSKKLIIFSDMREYGRHVDLESPNRIDVDKVLSEVISKKLIPSLDGVRVWCVGVHSSGKTPQYWNTLRDFWTRYFQQAKAIQPIVFSMERRILYE